MLLNYDYSFRAVRTKELSFWEEYQFEYLNANQLCDLYYSFSRCVLETNSGYSPITKLVFHQPKCLSVAAWPETHISRDWHPNCDEQTFDNFRSWHLLLLPAHLFFGSQILYFPLESPPTPRTQGLSKAGNCCFTLFNIHDNCMK